MLVDSHFHLDRLDLAQHDGSLDAALEAARGRGVGHFLCIGVSADNAGAVKALAERYADVDCSVGIHPLDVKPVRCRLWTGCSRSWITREWWR
ncbi:Deoxyribonuclease, TatD protein [Pseudomonas savastanoi]|uniref:Deoxyribonuclease, TatD protein n=1 Tax=Pseudomonas savastanoi TaxID=29438 RepID=A0A3M6B305_PSESS|nr:Deoxyribonuclease, TatD family protein [Pseudomonas syringae pv. cunninghamiae]RMV25901.1 Deoxyribonuclease, TatD protein [Pseudomonas savastanoi]